MIKCQSIKKALEFLRLFLLAVRTGLEPATLAVTGRYSNQLNYRTNFPTISGDDYSHLVEIVTRFWLKRGQM